MADVQRYAPCMWPSGHRSIEPYPSGDYVLYRDYADLLARHEQALALLAELQTDARVCALQARVKALQAGDREAFEGIIREINCQRPYRAASIAARGLELLKQDTKGGEEEDHG